MIFLMRSVLIGSFFTMGLPFALFADSITLLAHASSNGFGPLIGTNEWKHMHFRAACTMIRTEYDLCWFGEELEQTKNHYSRGKGITVGNRVLLAPGKKFPYLDKILFGG